MDHIEDQPATNRFRSVYWDDLAEDLKDPEFRREYEEFGHLIQNLDGIANATLQNDAAEDGDQLI